MITLKKFIPLILPLGWLTPDLIAQNYTIDFHKIAGGGGTSSGGPFSVSGSIGQPDAGGQMSGGGYSVTGGYWSLVSALQTPGAPLLTITCSGNQAVVSWPPSATGWTLQTSANVGVGNWVNYGGAVVNNVVTSSPPAGNLFFRLMRP
jgi:hypothetical protein